MKTQMLFCILFIVSTCLYSTIINIPGDQPTIQIGINVAVNGDTLLVQPGTYLENINYNGKNITTASLFLTTQDTTYISQTIIDGNQNGTVVSFENGETTGALLSGFTITNGSGGGISCVYNSYPRLENLVITENAAEYNGGGILCGAYASPSLENVIISNNSAGGNGGGLFCYNYCSPSLENVTISNNTSQNGGGIFCFENCSANFNNVIITNNSANSDGGGILCAENSNLNLQNVILTGNTAEGYGGGILCFDASPNLVNVTISDNTANEGSGIYCREYSNPVLIDCIFWDNSPVNIFFDIDGEPNNISISYSDIQGGEAGIVTNNNGTVIWLEGNIVEIPLFTGAGDHPFMLQDLSLCVNTGIPDTTGLNLPEFDLAGNPRVYGGRIDMGAYENQNVVVGSQEVFIPNITTLYQNYPNPFNPSTTISFNVTQTSSFVTLEIYNLKGQKVKDLSPGLCHAEPVKVRGETKYSVIWNGKDDNNKPVSSGIYFYKLKTGNFEKTKRMVLLK